MSKEEDKPSNNWGGARPGAGRPPKADEELMIKKMDAALAPDEAWEQLASKVNDGNVQAIRLYLHYRYGKPKERVELDTQMLAGFKVIRDEGN